MILRALLFAALAAAHEHGTPAVPGEEEEPEDVPLSYWHLESPARSWLHAHITLMLLAWIFLLPLCTLPPLPAAPVISTNSGNVTSGRL